MKKIYLYLIVLLSIPIIQSCGKDGKSGNAYISIHNSKQSNEICTRYWDDNPGISTGSSWNTYYKTQPGKFQYEYDAKRQNTYTGVWFENTYTGTYTISTNSGQEGGLFNDGEDGKDRNYDFYCNYGGPQLNYKSCFYKEKNQII